MPSSRVLRLRLASLCVLLALLSSVSSSSATKPRCRFEQLDLSTFDDTQELKVIGGIVDLEGQISTSRQARDFRLQVNGKSVLRADKLEPFEKSGRELYVALLVEISALYAPAIDKIKETLKEFVESLPPRTKVKLILFGYEIEQQPTFVPAPAVSPLIDDINPDDQGDVQLLNAINAGLAALNKVQPSKDKQGRPLLPPRKVMVVLSDGLNQLMDRKSFKRIGDLLKLSNVPLFPVAFSVRDDRGPLLNLGEMAKRSSGTFRWAQAADNLKVQFASLAMELRQTHVLTFSGKKLSLDELLSGTFALGCGELRSAPFVRAGAPPPKKRVWWHWVAGILGGLVGLWVLAQGAVLLLRFRAKRAGRGQVPAQLPGQPGQLHKAAGAGATVPLTAGFPAAPVAAAAGYQPVPITPGQRLSTATIIGIGAGPLGGQRTKVEANLYIGKAAAGPGSLVVPDDPSLGVVHCELRRDGAGFALFDLHPATGTFINDRKLSGPARLHDGDIIRLGASTQFRFRLDD